MHFFLDPLSSEKNFTDRAKSAEKKTLISMKIYTQGFFEVTYYEFALKIWKFRMDPICPTKIKKFT